jgi:hypothetical protein
MEPSGNHQGWVPILLTAAGTDLRLGETTTLKLKLSKKDRRRASKALDEGEKVKARVHGRVLDDPPCGSAGPRPRRCEANRLIRLVK